MSEGTAEILLVEDNPNDLELALHAFKKNGLSNRIRVARDGAEALDFLFRLAASGASAPNEANSANGEDVFPRLILLDLKLPKVDGIEVLRQVKSNPKTRKLPVVVMTSSRQDKDIDECYSLGANSYIVKPVDFDKFMAAVSILATYWLLYNQAAVV